MTEKIRWCAKQKRGIKLVEPNDNLCEAYLKKADDDLKAIKVNNEAGLKEWTAGAAYYARYHAIYALLQKCGIESEIHDCTIELMKKLFETTDLLEELEKAKRHRIDLQYYTDKSVDDKEFKENIETAPDFVVKIEELINKMNNDNIKEIRESLNKIIKK